MTLTAVLLLVSVLVLLVLLLLAPWQRTKIVGTPPPGIKFGAYNVGGLARILAGTRPSKIEYLPNGRALYFDVPVARLELVRRWVKWTNRRFVDKYGLEEGTPLARLLRGLVTNPQLGGVQEGIPIRTQIIVFQVSLTPASVATIVCAEQALTVTGILASDILIVAANTVAMATAVAAAAGHVSAANTIALAYCNPTAGALVPTPGTYNVAVLRG